MAYELFYGKLKDGEQVNHKCHNKPCCNPLHIYKGTQKDNMKDMTRAGRQAHLWGHANGRAKLTERQVNEIRLNKNNLSQIQQGKIYGVSHHTIGRIIHNQAWKTTTSRTSILMSFTKKGD